MCPPTSPTPSPATRFRRPGRPPGGGPAVREALLDGARQLFLARGFASVTIREIARYLGVTYDSVSSRLYRLEHRGLLLCEDRGRVSLYQEPSPRRPWLPQTSPLPRK